MHSPRLPWLAISLVLLLGCAAALLTGCDLAAIEATPVPETPVDTPVAPETTPGPTDQVEGTPLVPSVITVTVWTTEAFTPTQTITSGQILLDQVATFEAAHSDARLEFVLKKPQGKGGILDFLLTTQAVVPSLLPDLVFLEIGELGSAVQAGVVRPLDDLVPSELVADLYPFAQEAGTFGGQLYALQFQANLDHLAYNTGRLTVPPRSWPGVLSGVGPYIFPAGGQAGLVNDDFLTQYLAVRSWPAENADEPFLQQDALTAVLQYYRDGVTRGVFPADVVGYHTTDDCWRDYLGDEAILTHVSAHRYLTDGDSRPSTAMAPIPAINGAGAAISRGWALALVESDATRQPLALDFMTQLMSPEAAGAWNQAAGYLPTRQAALGTWDEENSYTRFASQLLQTARPRPRIANYTQVAAALQKAVEDVISGAATPEEAAAEAIESTQ
ncbi:MAG: extracellular solute-binding protein [Anaerolineae bacterium]|jgi:ABC-type glycerol-3-phosphate transport system substrate-binding protein